MSKKHNTKHHRSPSNYKERLRDRGLAKTPRMKWTGMSEPQIRRALDELPRYKWSVVRDPETGETWQRRTQVS